MRSMKIETEIEPLPDLGSSVQVEEQPSELVARLDLLWQQRRLLFRVVGWALVVATLIAFLVPKRFESTTRLMPPDSDSGNGMALLATLAGKAGGLGGMAGDLLGVKNSGDLFVGVLKSRSVQDEIIQKFDLGKVYRISRLDDVREELSSNASISLDRKSGIISITVTDHDPHRAADMAEYFVVALNNVVSQVSTSSARRERTFLEGRLETVKKDLEASEKEFSEFASKTGAIDVKEQGKAMLTAAATLQGELIAAQSQLEGLRQIYADNNVRVRSLKARVAELQAQLDKVGGKQEVVEEATHQNDDSLYPSIRKLPLLGVPYADLYRRTKVQEVVFETLTQEYELAKVAEAKEIPSVKVLDLANIPQKKSFPPRLLIIFLGASFALLVSGTWILGKEHWDQINANDPGKKLMIKVMSTANSRMPWAEPNGSRFQAATHKVWMRYASRNGHNGASNNGHNGLSNNNDMTVIEADHDKFPEA